MKLALASGLVIGGLLMVACKGGESDSAKEDRLHKALSGPPNLRAMRERMKDKAAAPAGSPSAGRPVPAAGGTAGS